MQIFKTTIKGTYLEGTFYLRSEGGNWAFPIDFPTVFTAYGKRIKSGNWHSCTSINTPQYVIDSYFSGNKDSLKSLWEIVFELEKITWEDVRNDKTHVLELINRANNELLKLPQL